MAACHLVIAFGMPFSGLELDLHEEEKGRTYIRVPFDSEESAAHAITQIRYEIEPATPRTYKASEIGCVVLSRQDERAA